MGNEWRSTGDEPPASEQPALLWLKTGKSTLEHLAMARSGYDDVADLGEFSYWMPLETADDVLRLMPLREHPHALGVFLEGKTTWRDTGILVSSGQDDHGTQTDEERLARLAATLVDAYATGKMTLESPTFAVDAVKAFGERVETEHAVAEFIDGHVQITRKHKSTKGTAEHDDR